MSKKEKTTKKKKIVEMTETEQNERKMSDGVITKRLLKYLMPYIWYFVLALVLMIFAIFGDIILPVLLGGAIDLLQTPDASLTKIIILMIVALMITLIYAVTEYCKR